ncbi:Aste57867_13331 [Aphanomyces stellatus]|uniref:Aste57867_13331 protein n=1 Tax=Aphanomyces stellatus TaxID=120398 RepID=A0A485KXU3_9STRA|nr:hypothetical protein As57867_013282 [Aphanomyces stellatus]VFT90170.1 Aste57867_13331 [Aphanomyces stellatus]
MIRDLICWIQANRVTSLELGPFQWTNDAVVHKLVAGNFACPTLAKVKLTGCMISPLPTFPSRLAMQELHLESCELTTNDIIRLSVGLVDSNVERLVLARTNHVHFGFQTLLQALPRSKVTNLELSHCGLGDQALATLAPLLVPTRLELLILDGNPITNVGVVAIGRAIRASPTIQYLCLQYC